MSSRRDFLFGRFRRGDDEAAQEPSPRPPRRAEPAARAAAAAAAPAVATAEPRGATAVPAEPRAAPAEPPPIPVLRPPGAIDERAFLEGCTKCGDCARACPYGAIVPAPIRFRAAAGTPMIDPMQAPCWQCEDAPCVEACEPEVLSWHGHARMGTARVQEFACLAWTGQMCFTCSERCPVPGAITLKAGKPVIDARTCTGCGVCQHVCPSPVNAILLVPSPERNGLAPMPEVRS